MREVDLDLYAAVSLIRTVVDLDLYAVDVLDPNAEVDLDLYGVDALDPNAEVDRRPGALIRTPVMSWPSCS